MADKFIFKSDFIIL